MIKNYSFVSFWDVREPRVWDPWFTTSIQIFLRFLLSQFLLSQLYKSNVEFSWWRFLDKPFWYYEREWGDDQTTNKSSVKFKRPNKLFRFQQINEKFRAPTSMFKFQNYCLDTSFRSNLKEKFLHFVRTFKNTCLL